MTQGSGGGEEGKRKVSSIDSLAICPGQTWVSVYEYLRFWSKAVESRVSMALTQRIKACVVGQAKQGFFLNTLSSGLA